MEYAHKSFFETSDFFAILFVGIGIVLEILFPTTLESTYVILFGAVLMVAAWTLIILAKVEFKRAGQKSAPRNPTTTLIERGVFKYLRNPTYVGVVLSVFSLGLLFGSMWVALGSLFTFFSIHYVLVIPEERYLEALFGETFREYKKRTRRWL